jgi:hypothetical protein
LDLLTGIKVFPRDSLPPLEHLPTRAPITDQSPRHATAPNPTAPAPTHSLRYLLSSYGTITLDVYDQHNVD